MVDREKVVRALDCLSRNAQDVPCNGCAYFRPFTDDPDTGWCDRTAAMADALAMLRELEPVQFKVTRQDKSYPFWDSVCTGCGYKTSTVKNYWKYCPVCGRAVKWE